MLNDRVDRLDLALHDAVQVRFDLSDAELVAVARAAEDVIDERFRGVALDGEAVLKLRELVAVLDSALERAHDGYDGGTLVMSVARLGLLVRSLGDWQARCRRIGFLRPGEAAAAPAADDLLEQLCGLHARAARVALGADDPAAVPV
jgi:hypothetical protein